MNCPHIWILSYKNVYHPHPWIKVFLIVSWNVSCQVKIIKLNKRSRCSSNEMFLLYEINTSLSCCWDDWFPLNFQVVLRNDVVILTSGCDPRPWTCWISRTLPLFAQCFWIILVGDGNDDTLIDAKSYVLFGLLNI